MDQISKLHWKKSMKYDEITVKVPLLGSGMLLCPGSSLLEVAISVHATKDLPG